MYNNKYCEYGIEELKYLPDNYNIVMDGAQFWLLAIKVLSEPGNITVPKDIADIIDRFRSHDEKTNTITISKKNILTLYNFKKIENVNIVSNENINICADIKKGIVAYLVEITNNNNALLNDALLRARSINSLDSLHGFITFIKGDNIPRNVKSALASYAKICLKEFQNNMDQELYKEMDNKISKLIIR